MVQAIINISDRANWILNIVKAKYGLKDKSEAINALAGEYEEVMEPELRPEFIERIKKREKEPAIEVGTVRDFRKMMGLD